MADAKRIAEWMTDEVRSAALPQWLAAARIEELFGTDFLRLTEGDRWSIAKEVRDLFHAMNPDVIWDKRNREWRMRDHWD